MKLVLTQSDWVFTHARISDRGLHPIDLLLDFGERRLGSPVFLDSTSSNLVSLTPLHGAISLIYINVNGSRRGIEENCPNPTRRTNRHLQACKFKTNRCRARIHGHVR